MLKDKTTIETKKFSPEKLGYPMFIGSLIFYFLFKLPLNFSVLCGSPNEGFYFLYGQFLLNEKVLGSIASPLLKLFYAVILKIFKRVPKNDLETIFPNAVPKMSVKDKLLLWVPFVVGGVSLLSAKVIPPLIVMYGAYKTGEILDLDKSKTSLTQGLVALGVLGAYLFRQYSNYVSKKIKFSKMLSDSLYFKNLGNNSGVFPALIDASEEEELKETILAYAFLYKRKQPLTADELDAQIELWFKDTFQLVMDFDVEDALKKLKKIGLGTETNGRWTVLPLEKAIIRVDEIWDGIFDYNQ